MPVAIRWEFGHSSLAVLGDAYIFASETVALDLVGAEYVRSVEPGELIVVTNGELRSHRPFPDAHARPCIFEHVYFSRPDSIVDGTSVYAVRKEIGAQLAIENPVDADLVIPVRTVAHQLPWAMQSNPKFHLNWVSSDPTMSVAPSFSPATVFAIWV